MTADRRLAQTTGDWRRALLRDKVELERLVLEARARNVRQSVRSERRLQRVRIPADAGPRFRSMPGRDSGACRTGIPVHAGPAFRRMPGQLM